MMASSATVRVELGDTVDWQRLRYRLLLAFVWLVSLAYAWAQIRLMLNMGTVGMDSHAYWLTGNESAALYGRPARTQDAFLYSPAFALLVRPLTLLPWTAFAIVWAVAETAALVWLVWGSRLRWTLPLVLIAGLAELGLGNVFVFFAVALVLAVAPGGTSARGAAMVLPVLTKVTPGVVLVWFLLSRQWARLAWASGATAVIVGVTYAVVPGWWQDWIQFMSSGDSQGSLNFPLRLVAALLLLAVCVRLHRPEMVPVVVLLALPVIGGPSPLIVLAAIPRILAATDDTRDGVSSRAASAL